MADLRINGWSDESLKCQRDLDLKRELVALLSLSSWCLVMVGGSPLRCHGFVFGL